MHPIKLASTESSLLGLVALIPGCIRPPIPTGESRMPIVDGAGTGGKFIETFFTQEDLAILFGHLETGMNLVPPDSAEHRRIALIAEEMAPVRTRLQPVESLAIPLAQLQPSTQ